MPRGERRTEWVAYVRVSTTEQAERDLSLPAQRRAIETYAKAHGATIAREFVEEGHSGTDPHRPAFRCMLEDALRPGSDVAVIVVHHSSRFTRDAMEARVSDAPRANELVVAVVVTAGGRPLPRIGGLRSADIKGEDGLR